MKGYRTLLVNAGIAAMTGVLTWAADVNWVEVVGEPWAVIMVAVVNVGMRLVTDTPVGQSK